MSEIPSDPRSRPSRSSHPVDVLIAEHDVILAVLAALESEAGRAAGGELRAGFWGRAARFVERFADRCHHGKEEDMLFPALAEAGMPCEQGPIGVMLSEHDEGRGLLEQLRRATADGDGPRVAAAARAYTLLLREHIAKENQVLFAMAREVIAPDRADALARDFSAFDRGPGTELRQEGLALASELCTDAGVEAPDAAGLEEPSPSR